ncbi:MAG: hypothetical protein U5L46_01600 [Agrobacterium sp.]|nr:hypothetical protein [Agrobacterium sp.]
MIDIYRVRRMVECGALRQAWHKHPSIRTMRTAVDDARIKPLAWQYWPGVRAAPMHEVPRRTMADLYSARLSDFDECIAAEPGCCLPAGIPN